MELMWIIAIILQCEFIHAMWRPYEPEHLRLYIDQHQSLLLPKYVSGLKILSPAAFGDHLYAPQLKPIKKPPKYAKASQMFTKFKPSFDLPDAGKKCCATKWPVEKEVSLEELIRPVSLPSHHTLSGGHQSFEDVKPVTEIIEGDLKYDFRTKTHSLR